MYIKYQLAFDFLDDENSRLNVPEEQKQPAPSFSSQENKISLLEKRLLGKTLGHTDIALEKHVAGNMYKSCLVNNANKVVGKLY